MKRKYIGLALISLFAFAAMFAVATPHKAAAAAPVGCGLLAPVNAANSDPNCLNQTYNTGGLTTCTVGDTYGTDTCESAGSSQATLKSNFVKNLQWYQTRGQPYQKISAAWMEQKLGGADWAARINEPAVTLTFTTNYPFTENSEYVPTSNTSGYVYYPYAEASTARWAIVIKVNGVVYDTIKLDCGNLVNGSNALPKPTTTIQGRIWNWTTNASYANVKISTCIATDPYVYTDSTGSFSIPNVPTGSTFCIRVAGGGPTGMQGPYARPSGNSYGYNCPGPTPTSTGFGTSKTSPLVGGKNYCAGDSTYENQYAGEYVANNYDRNQDSGYQLVYVLPPAIATDCTVDVTPSQLDPNTDYTVAASIQYQDASQATTVKQVDQLAITVAGPGVNYSNSNVPMQTSGAFVNGSVSPGPTHNAGQYSATAKITGPTGLTNCKTNFIVADRPYENTPGGDTSAGAGMSIGGTDCAVPADLNGGLVGWNNDGGKTGKDFTGAGTQYAAFALNHLQDFATAQGSSLAPSGLAFANTTDGDVNVSQGLFGGLYGGSACMQDYFANATDVHTGNFTFPGTIGDQNVSTNIANGTQEVVYVKGNVYINGNIKFSGSYANKGQIPSFSLVVQGNIYIAPNVTEMDGLYVAEPTNSTTGGVIYTCTQAPFAYQQLNSTLYNNCHGNSLTVNGSFVARQVWLLRAGGSISSTPAESVVFTPEAWLGIPPDETSGSGGSGDTYDAITSLPPIL